jgi:hypothetical protein
MEEKELDFNFKKGGEVYTILLISNGDEDSTISSLKNLIVSNSFRAEAAKIIVSISKRNNDLINSLEEIFDKMKDTYNFKIIFSEKEESKFDQIDRALSLVKTPFVFYFENGWQFASKDYIKNSIVVIGTQPKILQVSITDGSLLKNNVSTDLQDVVFGLQVRKIIPTVIEDNNKEHVYNGFSFNPHVLDMKRYEEIGRFNRFNSVYEIDDWYKKHGYLIYTFDKPSATIIE